MFVMRLALTGTATRQPAPGCRLRTGCPFVRVDRWSPWVTAVVAAVPGTVLSAYPACVDRCAFFRRGVHPVISRKKSHTVRLVAVHIFKLIDRHMRAVRIAKQTTARNGFCPWPPCRSSPSPPGGDVGTFTLGLDHLAVVAEERIVLVKFGLENHSSKPLFPGLAAPSAHTEPMCHCRCPVV